MPSAFLSYQTNDRSVAMQLKWLLESVGITAFLAHEDIAVSEQWRHRLCSELATCDVFVALLTTSYMQSAWCIQEAGIAAFRESIVIIPLSLDGTVPPGFLGHIQSVRVNPDSLGVEHIFPALARIDFEQAARAMIRHVAGAKSFRGAEDRFKAVLPYIDRFTDDQGRRLLEAAIDNDQVLHASLCIKNYLPLLAAKCVHLLNDVHAKKYNETLVHYGALL